MKRLMGIALLLFISACSSGPRMEILVVEGITNPPEEMTQNPFFTPSPLPFNAPDFDRIMDRDYKPAFEEGMRQQLQQIEQITVNPDDPTFENTLVPMQESGVLLTRVQRVFFNLTSAHTNEYLQEVQVEMAPGFAAHSDDIMLNRELFDRIDTVYQQRDELELNAEQLRLLEETRRNFERSGVLLGEAEQQRMREINERLSTLSTRFQEDLLTMTRERSVLIEEEAELEGLGSDRISAARQAAEELGHEEKFLLTLTNTTRQPVLSELASRELRQRVWEASAFRGTGEEGGVDTRPLILEMVRLRTERAALLGYPDWSSLVMERQTAQHPDAALAMLSDLIPAVIANTEQEAAEILQRMREDGLEGGLMPWDWEYYAEKVREERYDIDEQQVRNYFELERVLQNGVFYMLEMFYGITFRERDDIPVYHPDVRVFEVTEEDGTPLGLFYADLFSRDSKRGGAWMNSFVVQSRLLDKKPVIVNVLNIDKPADGDPALISFTNVTTLFHEIGHAVHGLFSDVTYPSLAGTSVPRDFVEFPSIFKEDWAIYPEVIRRYAIHHETGEPMPADLLERVIAAREFNQGFDTQEYLAATMIDMEWHMLTGDAVPDDVESFEQAALEKHGLAVTAVPPRYKSPYFAHIFSGGYSSNYYAYIWSEVMAADAFAYLRSRSGLTRENGDHYRQTILSQGGSREAGDLYLNFRGEEPDVRHLLIRRGLHAEAGE